MATYYIIPTQSNRPILEFDANSTSDALDIGCTCGYPAYVVDSQWNDIGGEVIS